jgi:multidrug efflux pump subunit AcrA (membrane-fusion protein)
MMKLIQQHLITRLLFLTLTALLFNSCDKEKSAVTAAPSLIEPKPITWDWNKYAQSTEMHLSAIPVDIQPKQSYDMQSESSGIITFEVTEKNTTVKKDQLIARMDVEDLSEQEKRLRIQREKTEIARIKEDSLEIPVKKKNAKEELDEARRKVKLLKMMLNNPATKEYSRELFSGDIGNIDVKALEEAEEGLSLAEKSYAFAKDFEEKLLAGDRTIQEMDTNKSERNLQKAKDRSLYTVPFDGELRLEVNFVEDQTEYTVSSREVIATLNNYDEIHAHLKVANSGWISLDPNRLYLQLGDKNNTLMQFNDDRIEKDDRTQREERKYIFSVPLEENTNLKRLTGTKMNSILIYRLPEQCYIVPKYDISLYALGKTDSLVWQDVVNTLWPNAKLLGVGHKHLAIKY